MDSGAELLDSRSRFLHRDQRGVGACAYVAGALVCCLCPFAETGTWQGREQVGHFFRRTAEVQDVVEFEPEEFIAPGPQPGRPSRGRDMKLKLAQFSTNILFALALAGFLLMIIALIVTLGVEVPIDRQIEQ